MSLFSRRWLLIGFLSLAACGFEPIYGVDKPANKIMGKIDVEVSNGTKCIRIARSPNRAFRSSRE